MNKHELVKLYEHLNDLPSLKIYITNLINNIIKQLVPLKINNYIFTNIKSISGKKDKFVFQLIMQEFNESYYEKPKKIKIIVTPTFLDLNIKIKYNLPIHIKKQLTYKLKQFLNY